MRTLPQLVEIDAKSPEGKEDAVSIGDFTDWQEHTLAFQHLSAYQKWKFQTLTGAGEPDEVWASPVSTNLFHLLGVNTVLGRTFVLNESQSVILSHQ